MVGGSAVGTGAAVGTSSVGAVAGMAVASGASVSGISSERVAAVGFGVALDLGVLVGRRVGILMGWRVGILMGWRVGVALGRGVRVGVALGMAVGLGCGVLVVVGAVVALRVGVAAGGVAVAQPQSAQASVTKLHSADNVRDIRAPRDGPEPDRMPGCPDYPQRAPALRRIQRAPQVEQLNVEISRLSRSVHQHL